MPTQTSPIFTILISIIGSGALSALITLITSHMLKELDYKYDYKKYVLQKRQQAYNDIELLLIRLGKKKMNILIGKPIHTIFIETTSNENPIHDFMDALTNTLNQQIFWISKEIHDKLIDLLNFLSNYHKEIKEFITLSQLKELGANNFEPIENFRIEICSQFFVDIKGLDDVEKFKSSKQHF